MTVEFGIRTPDGEVLDLCPDRTEAEARLVRYRDVWPDAQLVSVKQTSPTTWPLTVEPSDPEDPPIPC